MWNKTQDVPLDMLKEFTDSDLLYCVWADLNCHSVLYFSALFFQLKLLPNNELQHYFITVLVTNKLRDVYIHLWIRKLILHILLGFTSFEKVKGSFKQQEGEDVS